ncbi:Rrf2 family transcriptional regulator [Rothia sp. (in: high G+C Gram-positive bacteria)]|uniref:RrF2 family transcriptional regulator n=1 Tax=Rothia sp. (in: high G+C Gram-positive bacteria) TaxID=1885016 RepID=UPI000EBD05CC|nr:Rrf2 family transcriptional regulator [Rothia sp. (in: high G+C Gram-positive bacteria)]
MRLTAFSDVSLRILMLLSGLDGQKVSTQTIAEGVGTPYNHVAKSVAFLVNMGLLESTRGRTGGVLLSDAGRVATIGQVLRATEGGVAMVECEGGSTDCPMRHACSLRGVLAHAREEFFKLLDPVVISQLPNEKQMGPVFVELGLGPLGGARSLPSAA